EGNTGKMNLDGPMVRATGAKMMTVGAKLLEELDNVGPEGISEMVNPEFTPAPASTGSNSGSRGAAPDTKGIIDPLFEENPNDIIDPSFRGNPDSDSNSRSEPTI
ncbi:hypothetical protein HZA38_03650, partial [Candidatus Peregrinibacteria bacterium]|nr:hypothetical protein [Candidatus Peregrinibacteria bacterium]